MKIELQDLTLSFGEKVIFDEVTVRIQVGEITGIVGRNGAGKTSFFNILSGLLEPSKIKINLPNNWTKKNIGYLQTDNYHYPRMNGMEYLNLCSFASGNDKPEVNRLNQIFELPLFKSIDAYSSGMKKQLFLLGLLLQKKNILILDEPFNGLDLESSIVLNRILKTLSEYGKTILVSSHILGSLTNICNTIYLLESNEFKQFDKENFHQLVAKLDEEIVSADFRDLLKNY